MMRGILEGNEKSLMNPREAGSGGLEWYSPFLFVEKSMMIEPGARIRYNLMTMPKRIYSIVVEEESVHGYKKGRPGCYHRAV